MHINQLIKHKVERWIPYLFMLLVVISIIAFQVTHHFFINGIDTFFHMSVTYDAARQIQTGHFSYFLSAYGFYHSLRIVNAVYGPLGGYLSGLLLLITGSWIRWEIVIFFSVFLIAGVSMYQLCREWRVTKTYSTLIGCLYMFSFPIMSMWLNTQYDGLGAAFMPWVLYFGSRILNHDRFKSWQLILLLVILAELHVFSMLLGLLVLGMCYIVSLVINREGRIALSIKAVKVLVMTLILSFNVWGGILEVLRSNHHRIIPTYSNPNMFNNVWSSIFYNPQVSIHQNVFLLGLSTTLIIGLIFILYLFNARNFNVQLNFIIWILGLGFLWLSSRWFPWPLFQRHFPILDTDLQFPKRFLPVALTALCLILGILLTRLQHGMSNSHFGRFVMVIILGMFVLHAWQNTQYQAQYLQHEQATAHYYRRGLHHSTGDGWIHNQRRPAQLANSLRSSDPGRYFRIVTKSTPDYMPTNRPILTNAQYHELGAYGQYNRQIVNNPLRYRIRMSHHVARVTFNRRSTKPFTVPFVKYAHTQVTLNGRNLTRPRLTRVGAVHVHPRAGRNVMTFKYVPSWWYLPLTWLSLLFWLLFIIGIVFKLI